MKDNKIKIFNLRKHKQQKRAFYESTKGYADQMTREMQMCWKEKVEGGMSPTEAYFSCIKKYQPEKKKEK